MIDNGEHAPPDGSAGAGAVAATTGTLEHAPPGGVAGARPWGRRRECSSSPVSLTHLTTIAFEDAGENVSAAAAYWDGHRAAELKTGP